jgi:hypothetical protein
MALPFDLREGLPAAISVASGQRARLTGEWLGCFPVRHQSGSVLTSNGVARREAVIGSSSNPSRPPRNINKSREKKLENSISGEPHVVVRKLSAR